MLFLYINSEANINEFVNIFVSYHKDARKAINDPVFVMINRIINVRGKVNKLVAWKKHLAHLDKKLWLN